MTDALAAKNAEIERLRGALVDMLELHIAHHNNPAHVRARKAREG